MVYFKMAPPNFIYSLLFLLFYALLSVFYLLIGVQHSNKNVKVFLKCLPIFSLISWFLYQWTLVSDPNHQSLYLALLALVSSVTGDAFLVGHFKFGFVFGIAAFSLAQILYVIILSQFVVHTITLYTVISAAIIVSFIGICVMLLVYSRVKKILYRINEHRILVTSLILVYFVLISLMLWSSVCLYLHLVTTPAMMGLIGGALFYVSDLCIALSAIFDSIIFKRRIVVMTTYYASQFCMTVSVLNLCNDY